MGKLEDYLLKERESAFLIESDKPVEKEVNKEDYVRNAEPGLIVAFRLYFQSKAKVNLTKTISGKILENNQEEEQYIVETKNGLKYGVPYSAVVWVKTGNRWAKGVYEEMKKGSVEVKDSEDSNFGELGLNSFNLDEV